jgi:hypothetical protein
MKSVVASAILAMFLFVALFGLPMLLSHSEHHIGCPLQGAQTVMCESTIIEHFSIWQTMFASLLSLFVLVCAVLFSIWPLPVASEPVRIRLRRTPERPTLFQELFSSGILNRKEPYAFS